MVIGDMGSLRPGVPTLTDRPARDGRRHRPGENARGAEAQRPVRRSRTGCADHAPPRARRAARRATATSSSPVCAARSGPGLVQRRGVPRAGGDRAGGSVLRDGRPGERLWSRPALTVTGIDVLQVDHAVNAVVPTARAKISLRIHPAQDPRRRGPRSCSTSSRCGRSGSRSRSRLAEIGKGFSAATSGPAYRAARAALETAWGSEPVWVATGGSIPLVSAPRRGGSGRRDPALRHDGRLRRHPRPERTRVARRVREGGCSPRQSSSADSPTPPPRQETHHMSETPPPPHRRAPKGMMVRVLRRSSARQQDAEPGDPVLSLVIVIIVSALLAWADIKVTYQVAEAPPVAVEEVVQGGSTQPSGGLPDASVQEGDYTIIHGDGVSQSLLSADGELPLHLVRRQLPQLRGGRDHPRGHDRRRPRRTRRPDRGSDRKLVSVSSTRC